MGAGSSLGRRRNLKYLAGSYLILTIFLVAAMEPRGYEYIKLIAKIIPKESGLCKSMLALVEFNAKCNNMHNIIHQSECVKPGHHLPI